VIKAEMKNPELHTKQFLSFFFTTISLKTFGTSLHKDTSHNSSQSECSINHEQCQALPSKNAQIQYFY